MAAAATDLLQEVGTPGTATTLSAPGYTIGNTSITVGSTSNWPTTTGVTFAIDVVTIVNNEEVRVEGTYCEFVGTVASGTSITNVSKVFGTAQDYAAGATTRVYIPVSSERENRIVEWGLTHADQDGTLKAGAVDVAAVLADDVVTTAKILNANVTTAKMADDAVTAAKQVNGTVYRRQGGSSTIWSTAGTTTYDTSATDVKIQTGTLALDAAPKAVSFPVAFTYAPQVFVQVVTRSTNVFTPVDSVTTSGFNVTAITDAGGTNTSQTINWLAIGV